MENAVKPENKAWTLLKKAGRRRYGLDALSAMALGLFSSLIIGLILDQISKIPYMGWLAEFAAILAASSPVVGAAIGVAVAWGLKVKPLAIFSSAATGAFGYTLGGPVGSYVAAVVGAELGNLIAGKTRVDIVLVPIVTIVAGCLAGKFVGPGVSALMKGLGAFINEATQLQPVPMGIIVSVVMGMVLTAPISSAALAISLTERAWRRRGGGGLLLPDGGLRRGQLPGEQGRRAAGPGRGHQHAPGAQHPAPAPDLDSPTLASAILGPISTAALGMTNNAMGAGMGTSGLGGQHQRLVTMTAAGVAPPVVIIEIVVMHVLLPAALTLLFSGAHAQKGWIKAGTWPLTSMTSKRSGSAAFFAFTGGRGGAAAAPAGRLRCPRPTGPSAGRAGIVAGGGCRSHCRNRSRRRSQHRRRSQYRCRSRRPRAGASG